MRCTACESEITDPDDRHSIAPIDVCFGSTGEYLRFKIRSIIKRTSDPGVEEYLPFAIDPVFIEPVFDDTSDPDAEESNNEWRSRHEGEYHPDCCPQCNGT